MSDDIVARMMAAADEMKSLDDRLLLALAALVAKGGMQIIPTEHLTGINARPVVCLPRRMYDRMIEIIPKAEGDQT